jgi:dihydropteroate synthase
MGILNITPDSFSDGGLFYGVENAIRRGIQIAQEGADILDIGGESTRPGALSVSSKEQISRVVPVIKKLAKKINIPISIDTSNAEVAQKAIIAGASLVNDITGLRLDNNLAKVVARYKAGCIIMHIKGTPHNMQKAPRYKDLMKEICLWLKQGIAIAMKAGVAKERIIIDPGIGFGKTVLHNIEIIRNLSVLKRLGRPILIGTSRKSFIGKILAVPPNERLMGTAASVALAIANGAHIVRVHDIKEMVQVARVTDAILLR